MVNCLILINQDPDESDSSDSAFQSARSRESRHSTKIGKKERRNAEQEWRSAEARQSAPPPMPDRLSAENDTLSVQMDHLSLSSSQTPSRTPNRTPSRTPSRAPSLNQVWMSRDDPYVPAAYEGPQREPSPSPTSIHMLGQCNLRQGYNPTANAQSPANPGKRPDSWGKEQGNAKRTPMAALRGHSFNENWTHHTQEEFRPNKLRTQMSFNEMSSQNQGFSDKRSISLHGFQRNGRPPLTRRNPINAMSFNEPLTPLEQTPRGSMDSITIANTAGIVKCVISIIYEFLVIVSISFYCLIFCLHKAAKCFLGILEQGLVKLLFAEQCKLLEGQSVIYRHIILKPDFNGFYR